MTDEDRKYLTPAQLQAGIARNNSRALNAIHKQLKILYEEIVITAGSTRAIFPIPKSAKKFLAKYILIALPNDAAVLNNVFIIISEESGARSYVFNNDKFGQQILGAKVSLFATPGGSTPAEPVTQQPYRGMLPVFVEFEGVQNFVVDIVGNLVTYGAADTVNILVYGEQENKILESTGA